MGEPSWIKRYGEGITISVLAAIVCAGVGILAEKNSPYLGPVFFGLLAAGAVVVSGIAIVILRRMPLPRIKPSKKNIESCIRSWLDTHKVAVKNDPCDEAYFRYRITLDGGEVMTIARSKSDYSDYVQIIADMGIRGENKKFLEQFTADEMADIYLDLKMMLAQAKVGYSGLVDPPENFQVFRRVPIYSNLTEFAFMSMIGDVEAAMHLVTLVYLKLRLQKDRQVKHATPLSVSGTAPALEPPVA